MFSAEGFSQLAASCLRRFRSEASHHFRLTLPLPIHACGVSANLLLLKTSWVSYDSCPHSDKTMFTNALYLGCLLAVSSRPCGLALILSASIHASVPKPHLNFRVHCGSTLLPGQMPHWLTIAAWHIILKLRRLGQYKHLSCHVCRRLGIRMQPGQVVLVQSFSQGCREEFSQG